MEIINRTVASSNEMCKFLGISRAGLKHLCDEEVVIINERQKKSGSGHKYNVIKSFENILGRNNKGIYLNSKYKGELELKIINTLTHLKKIENKELPVNHSNHPAQMKLNEERLVKADETDLGMARLREVNASARLKEIEIEKKLENLVDVHEFEMKWSQVLLNFKTKLESIPSKLAPILVGLSVGEIKSELDSAIYNALKELSEKNYK